MMILAGIADFFGTIAERGVTADFLLLYNGSLLALPDGTVVKEYLIPRETFLQLEAFFAAIPDTCSYDKTGDAAFYRHYYARYDTPERLFGSDFMEDACYNTGYSRFCCTRISDKFHI